jgi:hypothetical protein
MSENPTSADGAQHPTSTDGVYVDGRRSRSALRLKARGRAEVRVGMTGFTPNIAKSLINVSLSGALIEVTEPVAEGRTVEVRLFGPEARAPVVRLAKVVRCDVGAKVTLGLKFENPVAGPELNRVTYAQ